MSLQVDTVQRDTAQPGVWTRKDWSHLKKAPKTDAIKTAKNAITSMAAQRAIKPLSSAYRDAAALKQGTFKAITPNATLPVAQAPAAVPSAAVPVSQVPPPSVEKPMPSVRPALGNPSPDLIDMIAIQEQQEAQTPKKATFPFRVEAPAFVPKEQQLSPAAAAALGLARENEQQGPLAPAAFLEDLVGAEKAESQAEAAVEVIIPPSAISLDPAVVFGEIKADKPVDKPADKPAVVSDKLVLRRVNSPKRKQPFEKETPKRYAIDKYIFGDEEIQFKRGQTSFISYVGQDIRFSQLTISQCLADSAITIDKLADTFRTKGFDLSKPPLRCVAMPDGKLTSFDNRRLTALRKGYNGMSVADKKAIKISVIIFHHSTSAIDDSQGNSIAKTFNDLLKKAEDRFAWLKLPEGIREGSYGHRIIQRMRSYTGDAPKLLFTKDGAFKDLHGFTKTPKINGVK